MFTVNQITGKSGSFEPAHVRAFTYTTKREALAAIAAIKISSIKKIAPRTYNVVINSSK